MLLLRTSIWRPLLLIVVAIMAMLMLASTAIARDSLGVFANWGAFRDPGVPRCYAIAKPAASRAARQYKPFATIATWPRRQVRNQVHFRLSRKMQPRAPIILRVGNRKFRLTGAGNNVWARNRQMDAAIVAAMRSAKKMALSTRDSKGRAFGNSYSLKGAATAMDAATVGCSRLR